MEMLQTDCKCKCDYDREIGLKRKYCLAAAGDANMWHATKREQAQEQRLATQTISKANISTCHDHDEVATAKETRL